MLIQIYDKEVKRASLPLPIEEIHKLNNFVHFPDGDSLPITFVTYNCPDRFIIRKYPNVDDSMASCIAEHIKDTNIIDDDIIFDYDKVSDVLYVVQKNELHNKYIYEDQGYGVSFRKNIETGKMIGFLIIDIMKRLNDGGNKNEK